MNNVYRRFGSGILKVNKVISPEVIVTWKSTGKFRNVNLTFDLAYSTGQKHLSSIRKILLSNSKTHCEIRTAVLGIPCLAVNRLSYGDRIVSDIRIVYLYLAVTFDRQKTCNWVLRFGYLASWQIAGNWKFCFVNSSINIHIYIYSERQK